VRPADGVSLGKPVTATDRDGRFVVAAPTGAADLVTVLAHAPGFAAGWRTWRGAAPADLWVKLAADDVPIAGRILDLEGKPVAGVAVHVRGAAPEVGTRVLDALRDGPAAAPGILSTPGKAVLDLAVTDVNKGVALDRMRGDAAVFFAGDDVTDETAFARLRPGDVGVKVGDGETAAAHRVPDPAALADLLGELLTARRTALTSR